ncbi:hypothetical protein V2E24_02055 [Mycoplasmopsis ciconiae]|uniref:FAD synthase n=1 Tax=Mycoplasmopsis ciconiae TaxID=561067 RepID=A0ABU7MLE4_9BACT|nr:hypothetical protein [Mycoplasmopsis ciconiae]
MNFSSQQDFFIYDLDTFEPEKNDIFVLGSFESLHMGHYQLFKKAIELKQTKQSRIVLVYFDNSNLPPSKNKEVFCDEQAKEWVIANLDIFDAALKLEFSKISLLDGFEFIEKLTKNKECNIIVGKDFRYGKAAKYDAFSINQHTNVSLDIIDFFKFNNFKISTSTLKEMIKENQFNQVNELLVYNYVISAKLLSNQFLKTSTYTIKLPKGIYACYTYVQNIKYYSYLKSDKDGNYSLYFIDFAYDYQHDLDVTVEILKQLNSNNSSEEFSEEDNYNQVKKYFIDLIKNY